MIATMNGARLKKITVGGSAFTPNLTSMCIGASLSLAVDKVTELDLTFQDTHDLQLFGSQKFRAGATIRYAEWYMSAGPLTLGTNSVGPTLNVKAPSKFVTALKAQTGAKSWGTTPLSEWVMSVAESVGMAHLVQPRFGPRTIVRKAPEGGNKPESTWDVLTQQAREMGVWLFEYGSMLVFAKPSYLVNAVWERRVWDMTWNDFNDFSEGMAGMPEYTNDPDAELRESLVVRLTSEDADKARPGDALILRGTHAVIMGGEWIVNAVDFPMTAAGVVTLTCQRVIDPKAEPPRSEATATTAAPGTAAVAGGGVPVPAGVPAAFDRFMARYNGRAIDRDGAYGAQCVDLTMQYAAEVFGVTVNGNGNQWYGNGAASGAFAQVPAGAAPVKGDIACWGSFYGGGYGHVAIVIADNGGSLQVLTQNPGGVHVDTLSKQGLQGYLRPRRAPVVGPVGISSVRGPVRAF